MPNITPSSKGGVSQDSSDILASKKRDIQLAVLRSKTSKGGLNQVSNLQMGYDNGFYSLFSQKGLDYETINQTPNIIILTDDDIDYRIQYPVYNSTVNGTINCHYGNNTKLFQFNSELPVTIYNKSSQTIYLDYYDQSATTSNNGILLAGVGGTDPIIGTLFSVSGSSGIPAGSSITNAILPRYTRKVEIGKLFLSTENSFSIAFNNKTEFFYIGSNILYNVYLPYATSSYSIPLTFTSIDSFFFTNSAVNGTSFNSSIINLIIPPDSQITTLPTVPATVTITCSQEQYQTIYDNAAAAGNPDPFGGSVPTTNPDGTVDITPLTPFSRDVEIDFANCSGIKNTTLQKITSITVSWNAFPNATSYKIFYTFQTKPYPETYMNVSDIPTDPAIVELASQTSKMFFQNNTDSIGELTKTIDVTGDINNINDRVFAYIYAYDKSGNRLTKFPKFCLKFMYDTGYYPPNQLQPAPFNTINGILLLRKTVYDLSVENTVKYILDETLNSSSVDFTNSKPLILQT